MKQQLLSEKMKDILLASAFFIIELTILFAVFSPASLSTVIAVIGQPVTVATNLSVGSSGPEIVSLSVNTDTAIDLTANATTIVAVEAIIRDYDGEDDIQNATSELFDNAASSFGAGDDNNDHYTNGTCVIDTAYGDAFEANATCIYELQYYANNATWNGTLFITDNSSFTDFGSDTETVNQLLAVGLPDSINYGEVNATQVSNEQVANVTNFGNVQINLTLEGYARTQGDNFAMNCTSGATENISVHYEKYNLTASNTSILNFAEFDARYVNLTNESVTRTYDLVYRTNDSDAYVDETNTTYWRIYVPLGVAGTCEGNIIFGASVGAGS